jgi:HK97 family phage major capsid protein
MKSRDLLLPLVDAETAPTSSGVPPFFGGVNMQWTVEAATRPETEPTWRSISLHAKDLTGYALISNPMADDAEGIDRWLVRLFAKSLAWFEDLAFINGNGVGKPVGMVQSGAAISTGDNATLTGRKNASGTQSAPSFLYNDASAMLSKLLPHSYPNAIWLVHPTQILNLVSLQDTSGKTAWVPNDRDRADGRSMGSLFGRPVYPCEKLPSGAISSGAAVGAKGDVFLCDPSLYVIGDRQLVTVDVSRDEPTAYKNNQSVWRVMERVDGQPWFGQTITLQDTTTVVSPYVVLN